MADKLSPDLPVSCGLGTIPVEIRGFIALEPLGMTANRRGITVMAGMLVAGTMLAGCQSPTYGTDKTASDQLVSDVSGILSLAPPPREKVDYKPRPALVRPSKAEIAALPAPQDSIASSENPNWVESPEEKRARLRAEADENSNDPSWRPKIDADMARASASQFPREKSTVMNTRSLESGVQPTGSSNALQAQQFKQKLAETRQGSPTSRKYLSEPPTDYRQASATAPVGELGEDELKKERRLKAAARKKKDKTWADLVPW
jgi:hypothetical protein